ncbi:MAG: response regulator [Leptolyngbya sp. SIO3F4]|nr:response regulator [Leptolyngbya sp. SIO3F4]
MAKILLIDSDRTNRQILQHALMLYEHQVISTQRGDEGLTLAAAETPDIIILDIDTIGLNGWQTIKILKETSSTWLIPVIAMASPKVTGQMLLQSGFDTYERKPVSAIFILKKIDVLLEKVTVTQTKIKSLSHVLSDCNIDSIPHPRDQSDHTAVVYIDNNPNDSLTMGKIVDGAGYSYANISDPLQALPQLMDYNPKLIFLELVLPVANGYELCAQIRRISIFQSTPVIIITNNDRIADRVRAKIVGASGFLSKPIKAQRVLKTLIKHLASPTEA